MNIDIANLCGEALGVLFTAVYQGMIVAGIISLALRILPRTNAATRHAILMSSLLVIAVLPFAQVNFAQLIASSADRSPLPEAASLNAPAPDAASQNSFSTEVAVEEELSAAFNSTAYESSRVETTPPENRFDEPTISPEIISSSSSAPPIIAAKEEPSPTSLWNQWRDCLAQIPDLLTLFVSPLLSMILAGTWILLAAVRLLLLGRQLVQLRQLKRTASVPSQSNLEIFELACAELNLHRQPALLISQKIQSPMAVGFFHPAVLLPMNSGMNPDQLRNLFRHELAHLKRSDDWANLIQQIIKAVFFFHPGILLLSRRLSVEREIACDDVVLSASASRRSYALFLTEFAGRASSRDWTAAPAAWSNKTQLKERVDMILNTKRNASPHLARTKSAVVSAAAILIAILAVQAGPKVALAGEAENSDAPRALRPPSIVAVAENGHSEDQRPEPESGPRIKEARGSSAASTFHGELAPESMERGLDDRPHPDARPVPPHPPGHRFPDGKPGRDGNLERRLDRLEALVESLVRENHDLRERHTRDFAFNFQPPKFDGKSFEYKHHFMPAPPDLERITRDAQREAEKAMREADRARRDAERDAGRARKEAGNINHNFLDAQRNAIEIQRHSIEKAMKTLEQQLADLERQQERLEEQLEKPERPEKPEKPEYRERPEKMERPERPEKPEKPEKKEGPEHNNEDPRPY